MHRALAGLVVTAVACDLGTAAVPEAALPPSDIASGTRLKAVVWEVDGSLLFRHFFDVGRNEECSFVELGTPRVGPGPIYWCLPRASSIHDASGGLAVFADAACTVPLAPMPPDGPVAYVVDRPADACSDRFDVHRAGAPKETQPYARDGTACVKLGGSITTQALGERIPLDAFVRAVERAAPASGRIWPLELVASDGARQPFGAWDRDRRAVTRAQDPGTLGDFRWLPARFAFVGAGTERFSDPACSQPTATKIGRDAQCPLSAAFAFEGECGRGELTEVGPPIPQASLYERNESGGCVAAGPRVLAFERGATIPRDTFTPAPSIERGGERVKLRGFAAAGEPVATAWDTFVDVATNEPCTPNDAIDGTLRCLPTASAAVSAFADPACTVPAYERGVDACGATPEPKVIRALGRVYEVGPEAPGLYERTSSGCVRRARTEGTRAFSLTEIDVARFAPATTREL